MVHGLCTLKGPLRTRGRPASCQGMLRDRGPDRTSRSRAVLTSRTKTFLLRRNLFRISCEEHVCIGTPAMSWCTDSPYRCSCTCAGACVRLGPHHFRLGQRAPGNRRLRRPATNPCGGSGGSSGVSCVACSWLYAWISLSPLALGSWHRQTRRSGYTSHANAMGGGALHKMGVAHMRVRVCCAVDEGVARMARREWRGYAACLAVGPELKG